MNDREKMLVDLQRAYRMACNTDPDGFVQFMEAHGEKLTALLDAEPTLEEVLAELAEHGSVQLWHDAIGWCCKLWLNNTAQAFNYDTPLQAAQECLRRVKE